MYISCQSLLIAVYYNSRMGDEREKAVGQLHEERKQFEKQVIQLVEQQEKILNEREGDLLFFSENKSDDF